MPPPPSFDYYAELEVERSASLTEINSAYRRLARIHHPDKNPDNQEEATAIFQRLQLAHETLSDPDKRERYDNGDPWEDEGDSFGFPPFPFPSFFDFFVASRMFRGPPRPGFSQARSAYDDLKAEDERRRQENKRREEDAKFMREREQRQRREAEKARREAAEKSEALARRRQESKRQEKRWGDMGAVSKDERFRTCLHSELCDKVQHKKKFKCSACTAKRGMIAFECPYCSASLCQLCVTDFSERRKKLVMQEQIEEHETSEDYTGASGKPTTDKSSADKPTTGKCPTKKPKIDKSLRQPSKETISGKRQDANKDNSERDPGLSEADEDEVAPASGRLFASDNPYDILADANKTKSSTDESSAPDASTSAQTAAPLSTARPEGAKGDDEKPASAKLAQSKKKRQNKKSSNKDSAKEDGNLNSKDDQPNAGITVEPKATGSIHTTHQQTVITGSSESPPQNVAAQSVSNDIIKDDIKTSEGIKTQQPKPPSASSHQKKPTGPGLGPTAGATGGYIRVLGPAHSPTTAALRQAMENFGAVRYLRITNKRSGIAHVDFAAHDSLRRAISASPVVVSQQVTVRVVELKHCDTCGKAGHVARNCRAANKPA